MMKFEYLFVRTFTIEPDLTIFEINIDKNLRYPYIRYPYRNIKGSTKNLMWHEEGNSLFHVIVGPQTEKLDGVIRHISEHENGNRITTLRLCMIDQSSIQRD